jgi:hypothetical protein
MKRKEINSTKILTPEDKQYLRRVANYLSSLGMKDGNIEVEMDNQEEFDYDNVAWDYVTHFTNNYNADIPSGLIPILQKIMKYCDDNNLIKEPDNDDMNYQRLEYDIDIDSKKINFTRLWSYYDRGDSQGVGWDDEEGKEIFDEWEKDGVLEDLEIPEGGTLTIPYNGGGDSGYLESSFDETNESVPEPIEEWCYRQISNNFSGWEINEGSDGNFTFDFNNKTINLVHTYNVELNDSDTYYEESFAN